MECRNCVSLGLVRETLRGLLFFAVSPHFSFYTQTHYGMNNEEFIVLSTTQRLLKTILGPRNLLSWAYVSTADIPVESLFSMLDALPSSQQTLVEITYEDEGVLLNAQFNWSARRVDIRFSGKHASLLPISYADLPSSGKIGLYATILRTVTWALAGEDKVEELIAFVEEYQTM